jgi:hypothetical protein
MGILTKQEHNGFKTIENGSNAKRIDILEVFG